MLEHFEFPEGATPISDCSGLIPNWVHNLHDLNRVEAENISFAQRKYLGQSVDDPFVWFQIKELKAIHHAMFGNVWNWAGKYRESITSIGIKPSLISIQLAELCAEVVSWSKYPVELTFLEKAARIHHRLVAIHPFENGNGRFSRLVADRYLLAWKCPHPMWPDNLNQKGSSRKNYIQTLKDADKGNYEPLVYFMQKYGANDPQLSELFRDVFYRPYVKGDGGVAIIKALLRRNSNPNVATPNGHRVLQLAVKAGLEKIVRLLVGSGAEVDIVDQSGLTPFQVAVIQQNKTIADFLISRGAKPRVPPGLGYVNYYNLYRK